MDSFLEGVEKTQVINSPKPLVKKSMKELNEVTSQVIKEPIAKTQVFQKNIVNARAYRSSIFHLNMLEEYEPRNQKGISLILQDMIVGNNETEKNSKAKENKSKVQFDLEDGKGAGEKENEEAQPRVSLKQINETYENYRKIRTSKRTLSLRHKTFIKLQERSNLLNEEPERLNITFWDYIRSFVCKSGALNKKLLLLKEGMKRIDERLDIFNIFRKLREVDKLKVLLLENEQLVLFDNLPKPHLKPKTRTQRLSETRRASTRSHLRDAKFITEKAKNELIAISYEKIKAKKEKSMIDSKLVEIYDEILEDHLPEV